jgi:hypothetical protein
MSPVTCGRRYCLRCYFDPIENKLIAWMMSGRNRALLLLLLRTSNERMKLKYENRELKRQLEEFCTR